MTYTVCPRSSDPFYIVSYNIKWVTTSWTFSMKIILWAQFQVLQSALGVCLTGVPGMP